MKCPNCNNELRWTFEKVPNKLISKCFLGCDGCGFMTDLTHPTAAIAEVESTYKWNYNHIQRSCE